MVSFGPVPHSVSGRGPASARLALSVRTARTKATLTVVMTVGEAFKGLSPSFILSLFISLLDLWLGFLLCTVSIQFEIDSFDHLFSQARSTT
jgi:hypothetical protein